LSRRPTVIRAYVELLRIGPFRSLLRDAQRPGGAQLHGFASGRLSGLVRLSPQQHSAVVLVLIEQFGCGQYAHPGAHAYFTIRGDLHACLLSADVTDLTRLRGVRAHRRSPCWISLESHWPEPLATATGNAAAAPR